MSAPGQVKSPGMSGIVRNRRTASRRLFPVASEDSPIAEYSSSNCGIERASRSSRRSTRAFARVGGTATIRCKRRRTQTTRDRAVSSIATTARTRSPCLSPSAKPSWTVKQAPNSPPSKAERLVAAAQTTRLRIGRGTHAASGRALARVGCRVPSDCRRVEEPTRNGGTATRQHSSRK